MTDAPEQAQAADAPETAAADNAAAQETSAPEQTSQPQAQTEIKSLSDLDKLAESLLAEEAEENAETKEPEKQTEEVKPEEKPETNTDTEGKPPVDRVRLTSLNDKDKAFVNTAVQMVKDGLATDIPDAIAKLSPNTEAKTEAVQEDKTPSEPEVDKFTQDIDAKKAEITETLKLLTQAKKDFDDEKETELTDKLTDLKTDIKLMQFKKEQQDDLTAKSNKTEYDTQYDGFRNQALAIYPDAAIEGSELFKQIESDIEWFQANNPAIFDTPNFPLLIAASSAAKIGKAPTFSVKSPEPATAPATQSPSAKVAARPVNPLVGGSATTVSSDVKSAVRQVESIRSAHDLDTLAEAVFGGR